MEVADIFRACGATWRRTEHLSLGSSRSCRPSSSAAARRWADMCCAAGCARTEIAYNSCRNRHCPKCQAQRRPALARCARRPICCRSSITTSSSRCPRRSAPIAYQNKAVIYGLLFEVAAETLLTLAADPKHLGAQIGATLVLHTWGSALTHHPHVHGIVPGGGFSPGRRHSGSPVGPGFFLPVRVLSRLFRRRFLEELGRAHRGGQLHFFGEHALLADAKAFAQWLAPLRQCEWVVYAKRPFAGPESVLEYLSRYTHRVAISNQRLIALDERGVSFRWKDYRAKGRTRYKTMTLIAGEFMRRFLLHVLPRGFHRIRHYGVLANACRKANLARARALLHAPAPDPLQHEGSDSKASTTPPTFVCAHCGCAMLIVQTFTPERTIRAPPQRPPAP